MRRRCLASSRRQRPLRGHDGASVRLAGEGLDAEAAEGVDQGPLAALVACSSGVGARRGEGRRLPTQEPVGSLACLAGCDDVVALWKLDQLQVADAVMPGEAEEMVKGRDMLA